MRPSLRKINVNKTPKTKKAAKGKTQLIPPLELHACMGLNACKGHDYFGDNKCAGKGECATQHHYCHTMNDCRGQGGCGLFGTKEEQCKPGENECAFQGSCGTPIPSSRFVTQGKNKGQSVWQIARGLFEKRMEKAQRTFGPSPMKYGPTLDWLAENVSSGSSCGFSGEKYCSFRSPAKAKVRHQKFVKESEEELPAALEACDKIIEESGD